MTSNNWSAWKAHTHERALEFGKAGTILCNKARPIRRMPCREYKRSRADGTLLSEADYVAELATRVSDENDNKVIAGIDNEMMMKFPEAFLLDFQYEESYKKAMRKNEEIGREVPKLISYLLSTMSISAKN